MGRGNIRLHTTKRAADKGSHIFHKPEEYAYLKYLLAEMPNNQHLEHPEIIDQYLPWTSELPDECRHFGCRSVGGQQKNQPLKEGVINYGR